MNARKLDYERRSLSPIMKSDLDLPLSRILSHLLFVGKEIIGNCFDRTWQLQKRSWLEKQFWVVCLRGRVQRDYQSETNKPIERHSSRLVTVELWHSFQLWVTKLIGMQRLAFQKHWHLHAVQSSYSTGICQIWFFFSEEFNCLQFAFGRVSAELDVARTFKTCSPWSQQTKMLRSDVMFEKSSKNWPTETREVDCVHSIGKAFKLSSNDSLWRESTRFIVVRYEEKQVARTISKQQ